MTKLTKKLTIITAFTLVWVSVFFLCTQTAKAESLQWNIDVQIVYNKLRFNYNLQENLSDMLDQQISLRGVYLGKKGKAEIVKNLKLQGFDDDQAYCYIFSGFKQVLDKIEKSVNKKHVDATLKFHPNQQQKFSYFEGKKGIVVDRLSLFKSILQSVGKGHTKIQLPTKDIAFETVEQLKQKTQLRASFSTVFPNSKPERIHNIQLAASKINGYILPANQIFSFNGVVGDRTEQSGYKSSKVILNGEYTDDFGGGVCQVSTTLYNAVLLSNVEIFAVCQHSLVPSYVAPSFDAMVSYPNNDFRFLNNTGSELYIEAYTEGKAITFSIYGKKNPYKIQRESVELERTKFQTKYITDAVKYPELIYTNDTKIVRTGSDMVKSEGYLNFYMDGKLISRQRIRKNTYAKVDMLIAQGKNPPPVVLTPPNTDPVTNFDQHLH